MSGTPTPNQGEKRLIILLPADLLEQVRQAAEEADLSVSQIVRRAIRNELKSIASAKVRKLTVEEVRLLLTRAGNQVPLSLLLDPASHETLSKLWPDATFGTLSELSGVSVAPEPTPENKKASTWISRATAKTNQGKK